MSSAEEQLRRSIQIRWRNVADTFEKRNAKLEESSTSDHPRPAINQLMENGYLRGCEMHKMRSQNDLENNGTKWNSLEKLLLLRLRNEENKEWSKIAKELKRSEEAVRKLYRK